MAANRKPAAARQDKRPQRADLEAVPSASAGDAELTAFLLNTRAHPVEKAVARDVLVARTALDANAALVEETRQGNDALVGQTRRLVKATWLLVVVTVVLAIASIVVAIVV